MREFFSNHELATSSMRSFEEARANLVKQGKIKRRKASDKKVFYSVVKEEELWGVWTCEVGRIFCWWVSQWNSWLWFGCSISTSSLSPAWPQPEKRQHDPSKEQTKHMATQILFDLQTSKKHEHNFLDGQQKS